MISTGNGPNRSFWSPSNCQAGLLRGGLLANRCRMKFTYLYRYRLAETTMDENRKYALFFAATIRIARKLQALDSDRPSPPKFCAVNRAIKQAKFILQRINTIATKGHLDLVLPLLLLPCDW